MVQVLGYVLGFGLIGFFIWFACKNIPAIVSSIKKIIVNCREKRRLKRLQKTQIDEKKEG